MNISRTLSLSILVISAALFVTGGQLVWNSYQEINEKNKISAALEVLQTKDDALIKMSLERSVVQVTSNLPDPIAPEFRKLLDDQRDKVDGAFEAASAALKHNEDILVNPSYIGDTLRETTAKLNTWREKADTQLKVPLKERDAKFIKDWPIEVPKIIENAAGKRLWLNIQASLIPPRILALQDAKYNLWRIREFGGRDRTYMAIAAARQEPLPSFFIDKMELLEGPVNRSHTVLSEMKIVGMFQKNPEIVEVLDEVEAAYFGSYMKLRTAFLEAGRQGKVYPISFGDFFTQSSQALDAVEQAHTAIGKYAEFYLNERGSDSFKMLMFYLACIAVTTLLSSYVFYYVKSRVGRRLHDLTQKTQHISQGDYTVDLQTLQSTDEIGVLAKATEVLREKSARAKHLEEETRQIEVKSKEDQRKQTLALADSFEEKIGSVSRAVSEVAQSLQHAASSLTQVAQHTAEQANAASVGSSVTSQNVQTVASATEELTASVSEINRQVGEATRITARAVTQAQQTDATIQGLADAAKRIDEVVGLINAIASQTNLLALNATIEAARAGEAGKGFAVVASEVKSLAQETAKATEDIATQVASIQGETEKAVHAIKDIGQTIEEVNRIATIIASAVEQQGAATQEISCNVQAAAQGTGEVSTNVENVRRGVSETTQAANDLQSASSEVSRQGALLSSEMDKLLKHLRAA